jgi:hypothetical protein
VKRDWYRIFNDRRVAVGIVEQIADDKFSVSVDGVFVGVVGSAKAALELIRRSKSETDYEPR